MYEAYNDRVPFVMEEKALFFVFEGYDEGLLIC
ncbi:hypothetical protein ME1_00461 [Bartonella vinsonii subsp. arupensis OK-94-513]|uniref:Uncharacterized protein n=2 Tax=Bartonella vinsonii subsp. arupensis TaxID=110578 RepID=J0QUR4_BARVI|nr:hypothetical protein ME1_00461 [Bartonella vinsonii subsp. arupensis OK-94-513]EJF98342.1 hypothetical protein MEI_00841 [Bartonella vinsonii subsp. arupensis Pm136co]